MGVLENSCSWNETDQPVSPGEAAVRVGSRHSHVHQHCNLLQCQTAEREVTVGEEGVGKPYNMGIQIMKQN